LTLYIDLEGKYEESYFMAALHDLVAADNNLWDFSAVAGSTNAC
jgi:hypothetical protein